MGKKKSFLTKLFTLVLLIALMFPTNVIAAGKTKMNASKKTVSVGKTCTVKLLNNKKNVKWSTSNKNIKIVSKNKKQAKIKGIKKGTSYLKAKVGRKTYKCKVVIQNLQSKEYGEGMYKVGKDIPAGNYVLFCTGRYDAYFQISKNASSKLESILLNGNFEYNYIVKVDKGNYLTLNRCKAVPEANAKISTNGSGMFRVGKDISAGVYQIVQTGNYSGYYEIDSDLRNSIGGIVENGNFNGNRYITVENGQYLKLVRCKIKK